MIFQKKYISGKFPIIVVFVLIVCIAVMWKMLTTMTSDKEECLEYKTKYIDGALKPAPANRGKILSDREEMMVGTLPLYKVGFDYLDGVRPLKKLKNDTKNAKENFKKDSLKREDEIKERYALIRSKLDSLAMGVDAICPQLGGVDSIKASFEIGMQKRLRYHMFCKSHVFDYNEKKRMNALFHNLGIRGLNWGESDESDVIVHREHSFNKLAYRVVGDVTTKDSIKEGLELAYDTILTGKAGKILDKRMRGRNVEEIIEAPLEGLDLKSTINITLQDFTEKTLREAVTNWEAEYGFCVVMDVKTGDVKAMVNLTRQEDGTYDETYNHAMRDLLEPGSTFKTASYLLLLDDGLIKMTDCVDSKKGTLEFYGHKMSDSGSHHGVNDVTNAFKYSLNTAVGKFVDDHYKSQPDKYVEGLKRIGIGTDLQMPFDHTAPVIHDPSNKKMWSKLSLPWMAHGYGLQLPPINTVAFYNAIANDGCFVKPRFVSATYRNGEKVEDLPVEVLNEKICSDETLQNIRSMLREVVNSGTGHNAATRYFNVSGKTGTAKISQGKKGYSERVYFASFCGFFPSEKPQYTCIVGIRTKKPTAAGGSAAAPVFKAVAEHLFAENISTDIILAKDTKHKMMPAVKNGNVNAAQNVLKLLNLTYDRTNASSIWGTATTSDDRIHLKNVDSDMKVIPDLTGMGARDAVYALQQRGVAARIRGCGTVKEQSLKAGTPVEKGLVVELTLK